MQKNKGIKKYVLTRQSHFGYTKQSYMGGTIVTVNFDEGTYTANGATFKDLRDIHIAIRAGFLDAFSESQKKKIDNQIKQQEERYNKLVESKKEKLPKMEIIKSDEDLIEPIPIENKKAKENDNKEENKMEVITENSEDTARGMTVVRSQTQELEESSQGTVVAVIGNTSDKVGARTAKTAKTAKKKSKESEERAAKTAEKRKADALKKRKSQNKEDK